MDGLIPSPYNAQVVVQPYIIPGNIMRYNQPSTSQFTSQMEWAADHVTFRVWNGWSSTPAPADIIYQWIYTTLAYIPLVGQERVHINLWLNGNTPISGVGDEMVIHSFNFQPPPLQFVPVVPCRVVNTQDNAEPAGFGPPSISGGASRSFYIRSGPCSIPSTAQAYSLNVTVVPHGDLGYLTVWPTDQDQPPVSTLNSIDGRVKANAAIVPAGTGGAISVYASNTTDVILDIDGYFVPSGSATFFPLTPCRIADTRWVTGPLGGPFMTANQTRTFPILSSSCSVPATATAYSLNFTAVPHGPLGFLTTWPTGVIPRPGVSTLNAPGGQVTANAAIVPAGTSGQIDVFTTNDTDLVIDINGYFAPSGTGGLSLYTMTPCRVLDTRNLSGSLPFSGTLSVSVATSQCSPPVNAQAYVFSATVVPPGGLGFLTLWPGGAQAQPLVSTLNSGDGAITSNMAIVPTTNGSISAFASDPTHLLLDIFGYFAP